MESTFIQIHNERNDSVSVHTVFGRSVYFQEVFKKQYERNKDSIYCVGIWKLKTN